MKFLFYLGHPAHFHLFKNIIEELKFKGHSLSILIKTKDVLENLLINSGLAYVNILPQSRQDTKMGIAQDLIKKSIKIFLQCLKNKPDLLIGTSVEIPYVGRVFGIPSINVNEDDKGVVPLYSKLGYPFASIIITPKSCHNGKWESKAVKYAGYHELAYLHPNRFTPDINIAKQYVPAESPYFLIRLAKLAAHHDIGIKGINTEIATKIISLLEPHGKVFITSERELEPQFEQYRLKLNPSDMHHVIHYATLYVGDSQTMAAEAGVLGTPFIRINDFVDRIGYLKELEKKYELGFGFNPVESRGLYSKIDELLAIPDIKNKFEARRQKMLSETIDVAAFMIWFFENYPKSAVVMRDNPDYQLRFK
jgi:predicted glycosyltransferase